MILSTVQLEEKMKWLKNYERIQEIQQQISWPPIGELDPRAYIPEVLNYAYLSLPRLR